MPTADPQSPVDPSGAPRPATVHAAHEHHGAVTMVSVQREARLAREELNALRRDFEAQLEERTASLRAEVDKAHQATHAKGEFLARMSHEIRTPMNGLIGMLDALHNTPLDARQSDFVSTARTSATMLLNLINDILDFSKIDAGKLPLEAAPFSLRTLAAQLVSLWQPQAAKKQLQLHCHLSPDLPAWLCGDSLRLTQIISNLLSNALKFTARGSVSLSIDAITDVDADPVLLRILVEDTGIGMSKEACDALFEPFMQVDGAATSRTYGGTGLGLAICRQLVALMQGEIIVDSTPGGGTTFTLLLPLPRASEPVTAAPAELPGHDVTAARAARPTQRILVVDDNEINRKVAEAILSHLGYVPAFANDGAQAVALFQQERFDLLLMDCHMPQMDGYAATRAIRSWEQQQGRSPVPIVAVSASAFQENREQCTAAGMDDFLPKPVTVQGLTTLLQRWFQRDGQAAAAPVIAPPVAAPVPNLPSSIFNVTQYSEMQRLSGASFPRLMAGYIRDGRLQLEAMRAAVAAGDTNAVAKGAHKLKGSSASIGADSLADLCGQMEVHGRTMAPDQALESIDSLSMCFEEVALLLQQHTGCDMPVQQS